MKSLVKSFLTFFMALFLLFVTCIGNSAFIVRAEEPEEIYVRYNGEEVVYIDVDDDVTISDITWDSQLFNVEIHNESGKKRLSVSGLNTVDVDGYPILGISDLKINNTVYKVNVYFLVKFQAVDIDNNTVIDNEVYQSMKITNWNDFAIYPKTIEGYTIKNDCYYDTYYHVYRCYKAEWLKNDEFLDYYLVSIGYQKQEGTYTLVTTPTTAFNTINYVITNAKDKVGNELSNMTGNSGNYLATAGGFTIDGNTAYCIEPVTPTANGAKYEKEEIAENVKAAIVTNLIENNNDFDTTLINTFVWKYIGNNIDTNNIKKYINNEAAELTAEESARVKEIEETVEKIYDYYTNNTMASFTTSTKGASIKDGTLVLDRNNFPTEVVLETDDTYLLSLYEKGYIKYSDGVTGTVDSTNGTLTLTLDKNVISDTSEITFSFIPENAVGSSFKYVSNYGNQNLAVFKFAATKEFTMHFKLEGTEAPKENPKKDDTKKEETNSVTPKTSDQSTVGLAYMGFIVSFIVFVSAILLRRNGTELKK